MLRLLLLSCLTLVRETTACLAPAPGLHRQPWLRTPVSSGSFAVPARQRRRSQRPCTKPCAHVERCILVATHCGLARLSPAPLMSHWWRQAAPNCSGGLQGGAPRQTSVSPTPRLCFWGSVGPKPRLLLGFSSTCTTFQNVLIPCVENVRVGHLGYAAAPGTPDSQALWRQMPADSA